MGDNIGSLFYPGNMLPITRGGGGKVCRPFRDLMETGGREVVAAVLSAPVHRQRGERG